MVVLEFIWYCLKCMVGFLGRAVSLGSIAPDLSWKDFFVGMTTFITLVAIVYLILYLTGVITFKKRNKK